MSGPNAYGPSAANQHFDPPPTHAYEDEQYQGHEASPQPRHAAYDSNGMPIPPGYVPPSRPPPASGDYFPPPPRQEYNEDHWDDEPRSDYDRGYGRAPRSDYGRDRGGYPPSDLPGHEYNQMTPYDEEKAEAEDRRGWEEDVRRYRQQMPPPPSNYGRRGPRYDDRDSRDGYHEDRRYDDRERYPRSDDVSSYDSRDRRYEKGGRRRDSRNSPTKTGKDIFGAREGQKGLSAQILGGAVGGLAGHEVGGSILETLGGVVVGAMGAKVLESQWEKRQAKSSSKEKAAMNAAPFRDDAVRDRRGSRPIREDRNYRDDVRDVRSRTRSRSRSRRAAPRRRSSYDSYSDFSDSRYSPPPRR